MEITTIMLRKAKQELSQRVEAINSFWIDVIRLEEEYKRCFPGVLCIPAARIMRHELLLHAIEQAFPEHWVNHNSVTKRGKNEKRIKS